MGCQLCTDLTEGPLRPSGQDLETMLDEYFDWHKLLPGHAGNIRPSAWHNKITYFGIATTPETWTLAEAWRPASRIVDWGAWTRALTIPAGRDSGRHTNIWTRTKIPAHIAIRYDNWNIIIDTTTTMLIYILPTYHNHSPHPLCQGPYVRRLLLGSSGITHSWI